MNHELYEKINSAIGFNTNAALKELSPLLEQRKQAAIRYQNTNQQGYLSMVEHCNNQIKKILGL